ncbi:hypothetical protein TI39_contig310g00017, partial [Zymoseptoria brevis]
SRPRRLCSSKAVHLLIVLLTNIFSIACTYWYSESHFRHRFSADLAGTDDVFPGLDRSFSLVTFSNHIVNTTSRWTAPPSKEVDHAWGELGVHDQGLLLPGDVGRAYGLDPRKHVYAPSGTLLEGEDGFPVFIQGLHDVHCLNELRRALYFNKPYYKKLENDTLTSEPFRRSHINHCLDNILETLRCRADTGLIPSVWTSPDENWPLFGRQHKCHSYEALLEWNNQWHESERERAVDWTVRLPAPKDAIYFDDTRREDVRERSNSGSNADEDW